MSVAGAAVTVSGVFAPGAAADTLTPAGCTTWAFGGGPEGSLYSQNGGWSPNCQVSTSALHTNAKMIAGAQNVLQGDTYLWGGTGVDCRWGTQSKNATIAFQQANGIAADGIVGSSTWKSMQGRLKFNGVDQKYFATFTAGLDTTNDRFGQADPYTDYPYNSSPYPGHWFVTKDGNHIGNMDTAAC